MDDLTFALHPAVLIQGQVTKCILEICNQTNSPITGLRFTLRAKTRQLLVLEGHRIDFDAIPAGEAVQKNITLQGQETGEAELVAQDIIGKHNRHTKEFSQQSIKLGISPALIKGPEPTPVVTGPKELAAPRRVFPDYLDCWIEINGCAGNYKVTIRRSMSESASQQFKLNPADFATDKLFTGQVNPREYGEDLFKQVIYNHPTIYSAFFSRREEADRLNKGLRIRLTIEDVELNSLAWELLFDPNEQQNYFVCLYKQSPIVRCIPLWSQARSLDFPSNIAVKPLLKILGLAVSPTGLSPLQIEREKRFIEHALEEPICQGKVLLKWSDAQNWGDFQGEIRKGDWNVLHFIGHSGSGGKLYLQGSGGQCQPISAEDFAMPIRDCASLKLIVLNSCSGAVSAQDDNFSSLAATLVRRGVPAVIAMQGPVIDTNAILLAYRFYEALADNLPIEAALSEARQNLKQAFTDHYYWALPVLFMRSLDGKLPGFSG